MVYCVILYFIAVSCVISKFAKGCQSNTKHKEERNSPWNIPLLILISPPFSVFSPVFKTNVVFHIGMMKEKFPYNRWYFKRFKTFFNPWMRYTIKGFFVVNPCDWQISVAVVTVFKDHFFISNWSLQPYDPRLHPFCSSGNKPLSIRNEYVYSVKTDVKILYFVVKEVIGRQFLGLLVSSDLGNKWVIQLTNHCRSCFGSVITKL